MTLQNSILLVKYIRGMKHELNLNKNQKLIDKSSYQIQPLNSRVFDFELRQNLKINDEVDCCDSSQIWYKSHVLEVKDEGTENKLVLIG
ncbi:ubiquitin carboxyl-terminal hydrolase family protein, putative [Ichthyophthirius multifiliis]|uniref:Ubiquitin carboxyl-terminal hydrolase family protein, putative n=1 Tax=Ichthyophthirius multifiliis TaxID=5932 RepID=G0QZS0_ICHMU|nr:ubiquitin carboxyl-terminal hydrolase family protein, putative [Ichthyophthirius multifiliis]EGR29287.1 ubiquitin carboxyl-terminal hydrolase family protein, putative [Ichthyophthirius multifiliis]|eukprot:XP_004030523.1 ubiquitin carboxyl-terminal hydrolase family protein, putative [Ichthyophthirius multifiliis]